MHASTVSHFLFNSSVVEHKLVKQIKASAKHPLTTWKMIGQHCLCQTT